MKLNFIQRWRLDYLLPRISAFSEVGDLIFSMTNHGYVPTLTVFADDEPQYAADRIETAALLVAGGGRVFLNGRFFGGSK